MLKLSNFPEHKDNFNYNDPEWKLFKEWSESLPTLIIKVENAMKYFYELESKSYNEKIDIKEVNTWYVFTLHECLEFAQNKKDINDAIELGKAPIIPLQIASMYASSSKQEVLVGWLNDNIYEKLTGRYWFSWTFWVAWHLRDAFFKEHLNAAARKKDTITELYLYRDWFEQAARICDYVLAYLKEYSKDERLKVITANNKNEVADVLSQ